MLFDPNWSIGVRPFQLSSLISWLESQPPESTYTYSDCGRCLLAQYFTAMGFKKIIITSESMYYRDPTERGQSLPSFFNQISLGSPRTFGDALKRAKEHLNAV